MSRQRNAVGGIVYHVLNRANAGRQLFSAPADYDAFEAVLIQAHQRLSIRTLAYCVMPSHWHFVLWPELDGQLSEFVHWLTTTHVKRWQAFRKSTGSGHLYQDRFKSFPIESDEHLMTVCRYVERNPMRAGLVARAEHWKWSSLSRFVGGDKEKLLCRWPIHRPRDWSQYVDRPETSGEIEQVRESLARGSPLGSRDWKERTARLLGIERTLHPIGRPPKKAKPHLRH